MKKTIIAIASASVLAVSAHAQNAPQSNTVGANGKLDQQIIGDTTSTADRTNSVSHQLGNSANNNGASFTPTVDTRDQNTVNSAGGAASAVGNTSDNKSNASNGNQTLGQVTNGNSSVGPTSSSSGGNHLATGPSTATTGPISNTNSAAGGGGGGGGAGGTASSSGTNLGINGQQQANTGTNAQGQTSANRNSTGGNTQSTTAGNGAGASAGAGAGANNRTANTTRVDASDRSLTTNTYTSKAVAWAPIIPGPVAAPLASANLVVIPGQCGPRVRVVATAVVGKQFGPFGGQYDVAQGQDTDTTMAQGADGQYEPYIVIGDDVWGQRVDRAIGAIGTSSSTNFSVGGFSSRGDAAQGGAGGSGSLQQIVARSFVTDCVIGKVIKPVVTREVLVEAKAIRE